MMQVYLNGRVAETHCKISTPLTLQCTLLKFQLINRSDIAQGPFSVTPNERPPGIQNFAALREVLDLCFKSNSATRHLLSVIIQAEGN